MATNVKYAEYVKPVLPNTPEMEALLRPAYQMTAKEARRLIKIHEADHSQVPWDVYQKALAFMAAYSTKAVVNAKLAEKEGWRRRPVRRVRGE